MSEPSPLLAPLKPAVTAARLWNGQRFIPDAWRTIADADPFPIEGRAIVSLKRWRADQEVLAAHGVPVGIKIDVAEAIDPAADDLGRLAVIALVFPKFSDGRAYSTARNLREVVGYRERGRELVELGTVHDPGVRRGVMLDGNGEQETHLPVRQVGRGRRRGFARTARISRG